MVLGGAGLTPADLVRVARAGQPVTIAPEGLRRMAAGRAVVEDHLRDDKPVYGLTTGLGPRVTQRLSRDLLADFSRLTILGRSNAVGPPLPPDLVRALMTARLNGLLIGGAGAAPVVAETIAAMLNAGLHPVMPSIGSVGASDLCLMAHLGLAMIGEGEIARDGARLPAKDALEKAGLNPLELGPKDGLAICNASSFSAAQAALVLHDAEEFLELAQIAAALSLEGFRGNLSPLDPRVAGARPAPGQESAAAGLRAQLSGGALTEPGAARRLQDPISLRCIAPVHGSLYAALDFLRPAVDAELNGAADNPLVLVEDGEILSTGNFQTPALALALDTLALALAQVAGLMLSRAVKLLIERLSGLPANLTTKGPTRSGLAPLLKSGEALNAEIRHLANPVPVEPRWTADGVEDDITNAPLAGKKAAEILWRLRLLCAMELIVAAQAVELARVERLGRGAAIAQAMVRRIVPRLDEDRPSGPDVERLDRDLLANGELLARLRAARGP